MKKLIFVAGMAAGYVLGARAGRKRYEQIKQAAQGIWETDPVQRSVQNAQDFAKDHIGDVADTVYSGAKKVVQSVVGGKGDKGSNSSAGSSGGSSQPTQSNETTPPKATKDWAPAPDTSNTESSSS